MSALCDMGVGLWHTNTLPKCMQRVLLLFLHLHCAGQEMTNGVKNMYISRAGVVNRQHSSIVLVCFDYFSAQLVLVCTDFEFFFLHINAKKRV